MKIITGKNVQELGTVGYGSLVVIDEGYYILCDPSDTEGITITPRAKCVDVRTGKIHKFDWDTLANVRDAEIVFE